MDSMKTISIVNAAASGTFFTIDVLVFKRLLLPKCNDSS